MKKKSVINRGQGPDESINVKGGKKLSRDEDYAPKKSITRE